MLHATDKYSTDSYDAHRMPRKGNVASKVTDSSHTDSRRDVRDMSPTRANSSIHQSSIDPKIMTWVCFPSACIRRYGCVVSSHSTDNTGRVSPSLLHRSKNSGVVWCTLMPRSYSCAHYSYRGGQLHRRQHSYTRDNILLVRRHLDN